MRHKRFLILTFATLFPERNVAFTGFDICSRVSRTTPLQAVSGSDDECSFDVKPLGRRQAFMSLATFVTAASLSPAANAFEKSFPDELTELDPQPANIVLGTRSNSQQRATAAAATAQVQKQNLENFNVENDWLPSIVWGAALWLLSGSRSNPLTTPLANLLYDEKEEQWLKDRNSGLFAPPPLALLVVLGLVFVFLGIFTQFLLLQLAEGDSGVCLQLAGVSLIGGGALELGRIASGEKRATREDFDRNVQLKEEFDEFAEKRLLPGGNCHRSDVVSAFRRYYAKYRQKDSEDYPLTDLEIEQLLRAWNKFENFGKAEMTSAGFYYGIQINKEADAFV